MIGNFSISLTFALMQEGGFSNDAHDPGGATMDGVTLTEFQSWFGSNKTVVDLKAITQSQIDQIYMTDYWTKIQGDSLPGGVDLSMFDMAVNAGPSESIKILQDELGVVSDGILGPITMKVLNRNSAGTICNWLYTGQMRFYRSLSTFHYFGNGWTNRAMARLKAAEALTIPVVHPMGKAM